MIIISVQAQYDNLGDVIIRAEMLQWLAPIAHVAAIVGEAPDDYLEALQAPPNVTFVRSLGDALRLARELGERASLVFSPGEQHLDLGVREWPRAAANLALAHAIKLRGGRVLKIGRGYRGEQTVLKQLEAGLVRASHLTLVRDQAATHMFPRAQWIPDVALASDRFGRDNGDHPRGLVSVSLRVDRAHPRELVQRTVDAAGLDPRFVVQVRRDDAVADSLDLGSSTTWSGSLVTQLPLVADAYTRSRYVVSDRLHSLLFGLLCGAIPIGIETGNFGKLERQLYPLGLGGQVMRGWSDDRLPALIAGPYEPMQAISTGALEQARLRLLEARRRVVHVLES
ncbi:polysaccharide pyruvyl transferase family protein [Agrococcus citreus]|uniref:Polysaccharide pyruvyl transferase domain-containing protein n=1 Tax=Agrococcus citreus TaxID=84643 RepID=A0ABN1YTJ8_9MICO